MNAESAKMTEKMKELIKDNLNAYKANFKYIKIIPAEYDGGFMYLQAKNKLNRVV